MSDVLSLKEKLKKIKMVITDVDGVLTDGGLYYSGDGMVMKRFDVKDGMGVVLLRKHGIKCGIISTDVSQIIDKRGERLKMDFVYTGIWDKETKMNEECEKQGILKENVAFIGDDVNDKSIMALAGFTAAPSDAVPEIAEMADYLCKKRGGRGAFRELAELILGAQTEQI